MRSVYVIAKVNGSVELAEVLESLDNWGVPYEVTSREPGAPKAVRKSNKTRKRRVLLSKEQANDMRKRWKAGEWASYRAASEKYGCSPSVARRVILRLDGWE